VNAEFQNTLESHRRLRGWTQAQLAERASTSRAEVSAIETGRHVPSTEVALGLARALECRIDDLFRLAGLEIEPLWAWPPRRSPCRFLRASAFGRTVLYPAEESSLGASAHDGVSTGKGVELRSAFDPERTLVVAGCDPALKLLSSELENAYGVRLLVLTRSSREALEMLRKRTVHVGGVHLADRSEKGGNARVVRDVLGPGYRLLRHARWQEGVALDPSLNIRSVRAAVRSNLTWIAREEGSGARRCLDRVLAEGSPRRKAARFLARSHAGVIEAIRSGVAEAGVCPRLFAHEAGLSFLEIRREDYDLCYPLELEGDPRLLALVEAVRSRAHRQLLGDLEGYDAAATGEVQTVS
jgi:molybdate-binding protein/DNA-binding XRE family transcriptional regulator